MRKRYLEFDLDSFEDFLVKRRVKIKRVDLVLDIKKILKARKIRGKDKEDRSCVTWRIDDYDLPREDLVVEGESEEVKERKEITDGT